MRREERREAILDVAQQAFLEHGYGGTTMSAIAGTLGGSKGTLWNYFPSKEHLFAAVLDRATAAFREQLRLTLNVAEPMRAALGQFCAMYIEKISSPPAIALHRLVISGARRAPEVGRIFYERAPLQTLHLVSGYLAAMMARGALRADDPFHAAQDLFALCRARSHQRLLVGVGPGLSGEDVAAQAEAALDLFLRAYAPEGQSGADLAMTPAAS